MNPIVDRLFHKLNKSLNQEQDKVVQRLNKYQL